MKNKVCCLGTMCILLSMILVGCKSSQSTNEQGVEKKAQEIIREVEKKKNEDITIEPTETVTVPPTVTKLPAAEAFTKSELNTKATTIRNRLYEIEDWYRGASYQTFYLPKREHWVTVFAYPDSDAGNYLDYFVDMWISDEQKDEDIMNGGCILSNTMQVLTIADQEFFRYDYSYMTESNTCLLAIQDNGDIIRNNLGGFLTNISDRDITVNISAYDMQFDKENSFGSGHTWKDYYFYLDGSEIKEYQALDLTEEEFLSFSGAKELKEQLIATYSGESQKLTFEYIKRMNGMLHINVLNEDDTMIEQRYETYRLDNDEIGEKINSGEGCYLLSAYDSQME